MQLEVDDADIHHMAKVLRLRAGELVIACDGRGNVRQCAYVATTPQGVLEPLGPCLFIPPPQTPVVIGFPLLKGDRTSWMIQKMTEAGVDKMIPVLAERSVIRLSRQSNASSGGPAARLRKVAKAAAAQSRRPWLPEISEPISLADIAQSEKVVLSQQGGEPIRCDGSVVVIGPEGGWSPKELGMGFPQVGLGENVFRAETAAIAAAALICGIRAGLVNCVTPRDK